MHLIDRFAYANAISRLNPAYKAGFSFALLILCLVVNSLPFSAGVLILCLLATLGWAKLPLRPVLKLISIETAFLVSGVLGVAISASKLETPGAVRVAGLWLLLTPASITLALKIFLRALACAAALNFFAMTTPLTDLIALGKKLRLPALLIDLMSLTYRFIFTLWDCFERMTKAREARLGFKDMRTTFRSLGEIIASLFIESYRRSKHLELALEARLWEGNFMVLDEKYEKLAFPWQNKAGSPCERGQQ
ncbi:MAG: cobalt ECF transporter T component CbiQ [Anaerolineaceae bacterium]|nr:cobalt ECF transporter T component CbiQ [Anaerolineaceae bacterium]